MNWMNKLNVPRQVAHSIQETILLFTSRARVRARSSLFTSDFCILTSDFKKKIGLLARSF